MELIKALNVINLMKERDHILDMGQSMSVATNAGWSIMINDMKIPIPTEVKTIFVDAVEKSLDYFDTEIKKL